MKGCLDGVRVLELARFQAGPRCGMLLSDLGAEVIKVEPPGGEQTRKLPPLVGERSIYFAVYNRGKKSICLDLRSDEGMSVLRDLIQTVDIVLENFRPGTMERMGLGFAELTGLRPGIILVRASAFGQEGPERDRPGFDPLGQARSGLMALTGGPLGPPMGTATSLIDRTTALHATIGALAALRHRDVTGEGQVVDVCLMDAALTLVEIPMVHYLATGREGGESGRPPYAAADGYVVISASTARMARRLAEVVGAPVDDDLQGDLPGAPSEARRRIVETWCASRTVAEICEALDEADIPVAPVLSVPEAATQPHVRNREMLVEVDDELVGRVHVPGLTIKFSAAPGRVGPVPAAGEHTDDVLMELPGYDADRVNELHDAGVIGDRRRVS